MKWHDKVLVALLVISFLYLYVSLADFSPPENKVFEKINELELKVDSLNKTKDSIRTIIDSTHIKIITNEKHYQERINTIINQSSSDDSSFISNYIKRYREQNPMWDSIGTREIKY